MLLPEVAGPKDIEGLLELIEQRVQADGVLSDALGQLARRVLILEKAVFSIPDVPVPDEPPPPPPPPVEEPPPPPVENPPVEEPPPVIVIPPTTHGYYDMLTARPEYWTGWAFRDPSLYAGKKYLTYDPAMDAVQVTIPQFYVTTTLAQSLTADATEIVPVNKTNTLWNAGLSIRIDNEILKVVTRVTGTDGKLASVKVARAQMGTVAADHAFDAPIEHATNTLQSKLPLPLGTEDGHRYLFTWDVRLGDAFLGVNPFNHKAFQFFSGGRDYTIFLELQQSYGGSALPAGYASTHQVRCYNNSATGEPWALTDGNTLGPGTTGGEPSGAAIGPRVPFLIRANTWTRYTVQIDQRAGDYDVLNVWMADEDRDPVQTLTDRLISVRTTGSFAGISGWQIQFNSSNDTITRPDLRDLVAHVRNFAALRDVADIAPLLVRPETAR